MNKNKKDTKTKVTKSRGQFAIVLLSFKRNKLAMAGLIILFILFLTAIFAPFIAPYGFDTTDYDNTFQQPSAEHLFGTDEFGRDIFSRVVYGSRLSLSVGFIAVAISVVIGGTLGAIAGFYQKQIDNLIMRFMDILLAIPQFLLAISIVAVLGPGLFNLMIAVGISSIPRYARIVRATTMTIKGEEYIEAAVASGTNDTGIIFKHILPNCMAPLIVQISLGIADAILMAAGLSFIGLGIQPPAPEWGAMLSGGRNYIRGWAYMTYFPGLAIFFTTLSLNLVGDGLRDALDPKLKN
jgi:peptide/nickel transport system permease protein